MISFSRLLVKLHASFVYRYITVCVIFGAHCKLATDILIWKRKHIPDVQCKLHACKVHDIGVVND